MTMQQLCRVEDVPEDQSRGFELDNHSLLVVHKDGRLHVYVNWCPHLGIELNFLPDQFLDSDGQFLMCANHGALFEIETGDCISGPCAGDALRAVPHEVRDGALWVGPVAQQS